MSDIAEKLEPVRESSGRARATLEQLNKRWGCKEKLDPKKPPRFVCVFQADGARESWVLLDGQGAGKDALFECIKVAPAERRP